MGHIAKDDSKFFDAIAEARSTVNPVLNAKIQATWASFMGAPVAAVKKKIQAAGVSSDFAQLTKDAFNVTVQEDNFDLGYEQAFRTVSLGTGQDAWEIYDVANGITFNKVEEGQRIQVDKLSGTKTTAYVDYYGGALGWTDKMIRFRKVPAMVDIAMAFRNKFWANKADNHYLLLATAAALNTTTYQGATADGQLQRDIQTINEGAFQLANRCKDKGYGDTATAQMVMYYNPKDKNRILAAFNATTSVLAQAGKVGQAINWNITPIATFNSNISSGSPIIVLPKNKIQRADAMMPTTFTAAKDPLTLNELQSVWAIYGGVVGDTDQAEQITLG